MPKKTPRNAFYFFMKDVQQEERRRGHNYSMSEISAIAHPRWKSLPDAEKQQYEAIAKAEKERAKTTFEGKYTSDGYEISNMLRYEQEEELRKKQLVEEVKVYVNALKNRGNGLSGIASNSFYIISFNLLCQTEESEYIPVEIGIVEYSIEDGIKDTYHKFIDPGEIPIGYSSMAKQHSEETHNIPIVRFEQNDKDYTKISREIGRFIKDRTLNPMVFSITSQMAQTEGCLLWLRSVTQDVSLDPIVVRDLLVLLLELRAATGDPFPSSAIAEDMLSKSVFDFVPNINCTFHESIDNINCALGYAKRLCFMLSDALCQKYGVTPTSKHLPKRSETEVAYEVVKPPMGKTASIVSVPTSSTTLQPTGGTSTYYYDVDEEASAPSVATAARQPVTQLRMGLSGVGRGAGIGRSRPLNKS